MSQYKKKVFKASLVFFTLLVVVVVVIIFTLLHLKWFNHSNVVIVGVKKMTKALKKLELLVPAI